MGKKKIEIGYEAPLFKLESYNAGTIDLEQLNAENQKIVLLFSRYFGCPLCQLDLKELMENVNTIEEKGAKILYITQSSEKFAKEFIEKENIKFPLIPSTKDELYKDYGLGLITVGAITKIPKKLKQAKKLGIEHGPYEGWEKQSPGQFVIEKGIIIHS